MLRPSPHVNYIVRHKESVEPTVSTAPVYAQIKLSNWWPFRTIVQFALIQCFSLLFRLFLFVSLCAINSNYVKCNIFINTFAKTALRVRGVINLSAQPVGPVGPVACSVRFGGQGSGLGGVLAWQCQDAQVGQLINASLKQSRRGSRRGSRSFLLLTRQMWENALARQAEDSDSYADAQWVR